MKRQCNERFLEGSTSSPRCCQTSQVGPIVGRRTRGRGGWLTKKRRPATRSQKSGSQIEKGRRLPAGPRVMASCRDWRLQRRLVQDRLNVVLLFRAAEAENLQRRLFLQH